MLKFLAATKIISGVRVSVWDRLDVAVKWFVIFCILVVMATLFVG